MATATKKPSPTSARAGTPSRGLGMIVRAFDAVYRFLASLKLAVFSLATLASVLAYATFFESWYGTAAVQERIYQSPGFAILLAFLAANILCAALIRFPWKKRQTGFVVTHVGLLTVLAGSWVTLQGSNEGRVGLAEGEVTSELVRSDYPAIRVRKLDPETRRPVPPEYLLPFRPGAFPWEPGRFEVLTDKKEPFRLAVKASLPASGPYRYVCFPGEKPGGQPMIKLQLQVKPPNSPTFLDAFAQQGRGWQPRDPRWLISRVPVFHNGVDVNPARITFQVVDRPEMVDDFLKPPRPTGPDGAVRIHYQDRAGKDRQHDWALDGQAGQVVALADSDLTVKFVKTGVMDDEQGLLSDSIGEPELHAAQFEVKKGDGPEVMHTGWAGLPTIPNVLTGHPASAPLVQISYFRPALDGPGQMGRIEVLGTPDRKLYYRVIGREGLRGEGKPLPIGEDVPTLGGGKTPMEIHFQVDDYYPNGRERKVCDPIDLPKEKKGEGIAACLVEMTVDGHTEETWLRRANSNVDSDFQVVNFPSGRYEVAYDCDRIDLGFQIALDDFDVRMDPGTQQPKSFKSEIRLTDEAKGIKDRPVTIEMNRTMTHRQWTFYQAHYEPILDRRNQNSGKFRSIFQVGYDPGRALKYGGGLLVVLGAFVQFYMRAGIFTDGGKRERSRAEAKAHKKGRPSTADGPADGGPETDTEPL